MKFRDLFSGKSEPKPVKLPAILEPEDPVNYDTVLDWVVGLSDDDYAKFIVVSNSYRDVNQQAADTLGIKNKPTTKIKHSKPTAKQIDDDLDSLLLTDSKDLKAAVVNNPVKKPRSKKVRQIHNA